MNNIIKFPSEKIIRIDPVIEQTVKQFMIMKKTKFEEIKNHESILNQHINDINKIWAFLDKKTKLNIKKSIRENDNYFKSKFKYLLEKGV